MCFKISLVIFLKWVTFLWVHDLYNLQCMSYSLSRHFDCVCMRMTADDTCGARIVHSISLRFKFMWFPRFRLCFFHQGSCVKRINGIWKSENTVAFCFLYTHYDLCKLSCKKSIVFTSNIVCVHSTFLLLFYTIPNFIESFQLSVFILYVISYRKK